MGTSTENFSLVWEDFLENARKNFSDLRDDIDFSDVTLVCEDNHQVAAHRVVLSSCSPRLSSLLRGLSHPKPLLFLWGVRAEQLEAVMDFCYRGQVTLSDRELGDFLRLAKMIGVKGVDGTETVEDNIDLGKQLDLSTSMNGQISPDSLENTILTETQVKIEPKKKNEPLTKTIKNYESMIQSPIYDYFLTNKDYPTSSKCRQCGKNVERKMVGPNKARFSHQLMIHHLRRHTKEFEQWSLIQRKLVFEARKIKFGNTMQLKENEKIVENSVEELLDNFEKNQNEITLGVNNLEQDNTETEIKVETNESDSIEPLTDQETCSTKRLKISFNCKYPNCPFLGKDTYNLKRHEKRNHEEKVENIIPNSSNQMLSSNMPEDAESKLREIWSKMAK